MVMVMVMVMVTVNSKELIGRVETESGGTRRRTGGEVKGKEEKGVGSQQSSV